MEREILFRGKRVDNREWVFGWYMLNEDHDIDIGLWLTPNDWRIYTPIPETVGQFTGITDKNGVKIFEGDICKLTYQKKWYKSKGIKIVDCGIGVIKWDYCCWMIETKFGEDKRFLAFPEAFCYLTNEVIGNVFDNPKLLK